MKHIKVMLLENNSETAINLIKTYINCAPQDIEIIELAKISRRVLVKKWLFERTKYCALYTDYLKYQHKRRLWVLFLCLGNASQKLILESSGRITKLSTLKSFFTNLFLLPLELFSSLLLWYIFIIFLPICKIYFKSKPGQKYKIINNKRMAFLRTNFWFDIKFGGSVSHVKGITEALQSSGYSVEFISSDALKNIKAPVNVINPGSFFTYYPKLAKLIYNFTFFVYAAKILQKMRPQFLYHRHDALIFSNILLARFLHIPIFLEFNSSEVWQHKYWGGEKSLWLYKICEEIALYGADHIVTVSKVNKENLLKGYKILQEKITVNPNGVDPNIFYPDNKVRDEIRHKLELQEKIVVGFIGSFANWHGIDIMASIMIDVIKINPKVHFLWVGDGPCMKNITENVKEYNLQENVTIVGIVPYKEIPDYLNACDILVSPHTPQVDGNEFFGSPTKLFEYMAMEKGIVASNLGQIGQVLENMKDGILVEPGNREELTKGILKLVNDPSLRKYLGRNARTKVMRMFTWKVNAKRVLEALDYLN